MKFSLPILSLIWSSQLLALSSAFAPVLPGGTTVTSPSDGSSSRFLSSSSGESNNDASVTPSRRSFVASLVIPTVGGILGGVIGSPSRANAEDSDGADESFASIAERANKMSKNVGSASAPPPSRRTSDKTAYDFSFPVAGTAIPFADLIQQQNASDDPASTSTSSTAKKVKAILIVNIKQDDPIARKTIPELISLATKYSGRSAGATTGAFAVIACPTDQGYYEPDTSALVRLKLASEYGYGINPATIITDKMNMLGTGAHPFWRWLESNCRTPAGLGRIEGNFEKFLIDGETGYPLRRYPRKYLPSDIADDIEAVIAGRQLPPARANFMEEWRSAAVEAERDVYRFQKGLNVFDMDE
jgi:glutathione peroxidase-family protein